MARPISALLLTSLLLVACPAVADEPGATASVEALHVALLGAMKDATTLGYAGRVERIAPAVEASFDLDFMARFVLGPGGKDLSAADQARWRDAFARVTVATYAG
jgi:phospholipid transport system substrate-binding protein